MCTTGLANSPTAVWLRDVYTKAYVYQMFTQNEGNIREGRPPHGRGEEERSLLLEWQGRQLSLQVGDLQEPR
jgi:hypothetical protein